MCVQVADIRFELAVDPSTPNVPAFFNRREPEAFFLYAFRPDMFMPTAAPDATFVVPKECTRP